MIVNFSCVRFMRPHFPAGGPVRPIYEDGETNRGGWEEATVTRLDRVRERLTPLKTALLEHPIYQEIDSLGALRRFMEHHAFAVWDFMSLLKALQRRLCCVEVPWLPAADPLGSRLVNEIVLAEESDEDGHGGYVSHFGLYRRAMIRCRANTASIDGFLAELGQGRAVAAALDAVGVAACVRRLVGQTFEVIESGSLPAIASAFTFGREDLLPEVFQRIVDELNVETSGGLEDFRYYLHRHIGLDADEHGPMAGRLLVTLCGSDEAHWQAVEDAAVAALEARRDLWDGVCATLRQKKDSPLSVSTSKSTKRRKLSGPKSDE